MKSVKLNYDFAPFDITILPGIVVKVKAIKPIDYMLASECARRKLDQLEPSVEICAAAGLTDPSNLTEVQSREIREAYFTQFKAEELGKRLILEFVSGIVDDETEGKVEVNESTIETFLRLPLVAQAFVASLTARQMEMLQAKKESATDAPGISKPAAVANTATDAETKDSNAAAANNLH